MYYKILYSLNVGQGKGSHFIKNHLSIICGQHVFICALLWLN